MGDDSLFADLFLYRSRVGENGKRDRSPTEDWLTECLAAALRACARANRAGLSEVLASLSGNDVAQIQNGLELSKFRIETQVVCEDGTRPDMVFYLGESPWLVIENKVDHSAHIKQLRNYANWLNANRAEIEPEGVRPAIAFVSHYTSPPDKFTTGSSAFCGLNATATKWASVSRILNKSCEGLGRDSHAKLLAAAFHQQLESMGMATEYPNNSTLAATQMFMGVGQQIDDLVNEMLVDASPAGNFHRMTTYKAHPHFETGLYRATRWAKVGPNNIDAEVMVGFWFPEIGSYTLDVRECMGIEVSRETKVFISIDAEELMQETTGAPAGWHRDSDEFLAFVDYSSFAGGPEDQALSVRKWIRERSKEIADFLTSPSAPAW